MIAGVISVASWGGSVSGEMKKKVPPTAFSVQYKDPRYQEIDFAADWDFWKYYKQWSRSWKWINRATLWTPQHGLDTRAYDAILTHFGLDEWKDEFPIWRVFRMSPAALLHARRDKEARLNLPRHEAKNCTLGGEEATPEDYE